MEVKINNSSLNYIIDKYKSNIEYIKNVPEYEKNEKMIQFLSGTFCAIVYALIAEKQITFQEQKEEYKFYHLVESQYHNEIQKLSEKMVKENSDLVKIVEEFTNFMKLDFMKYIQSDNFKADIDSTDEELSFELMVMKMIGCEEAKKITKDSLQKIIKYVKAIVINFINDNIDFITNCDSASIKDIMKLKNCCNNDNIEKLIESFIFFIWINFLFMYTENKKDSAYSMVMKYLTLASVLGMNSHIGKKHYEEEMAKTIAIFVIANIYTEICENNTDICCMNDTEYVNYMACIRSKIQPKILCLSKEKIYGYSKNFVEILKHKAEKLEQSMDNFEKETGIKLSDNNEIKTIKKFLFDKKLLPASTQTQRIDLYDLMESYRDKLYGNATFYNIRLAKVVKLTLIDLINDGLKNLLKQELDIIDIDDDTKFLLEYNYCYNLQNCSEEFAGMYMKMLIKASEIYKGHGEKIELL